MIIAYFLGREIEIEKSCYATEGDSKGINIAKLC